MSANLDDLSNDEIRIKLLQYGFANMPVTQTTRKVLVKKLKNAMETQKTKNRRETVAVIKSSDDEDVPEPKSRERTPNRRATIAVTEKTKKAQASSSSESIPKSEEAKVSRRSSRATPVKDPKPVVSSTEVVNEESDDDIVEVKTYITRRSKTPTMTKSEIVRTSYKNPVETVINEAIAPRKNFSEEAAQPISPIQTTTRRKTFTSASIENFDLPPPPRTETPTKFGKSTLTTSYNPSGNYRFEKEVDEEDYDLDEKDTPYLSNFAKRLSTLKAEPLDAGLPKKKYADLRKTDGYPSVSGSYNKYSSQFTSSYQPTNRPSVVKQMAKDFDSIDRKYSIRKYVYIAMLVMVIIAIYVLLFL